MDRNNIQSEFEVLHEERRVHLIFMASWIGVFKIIILFSWDMNDDITWKRNSFASLFFCVNDEDQFSFVGVQLVIMSFFPLLDTYHNCIPTKQTWSNEDICSCNLCTDTFCSLIFEQESLRSIEDRRINRSRYIK